jgi:predicted double-glycine peptidase
MPAELMSMKATVIRKSCSLLAAALILWVFGATAPDHGGHAALAAERATPDKVILQEWDISCGAAALATILTYQHGDPVSERQIVAALLERTSAIRVHQRLGFSLLDLKRYAEARGYDAAGYGSLDLADLAALGPAIVPLRLEGRRHFVVFRGIERDRLLLADPAVGSRIMPVAQFERAWTSHIAFTLRRRDGAAAVDELSATPADFAAAQSAPQRADGPP